MRTPTFTNQFERDIKLAEKRKKDLTQIKAVMFDIICEKPLMQKNNDHPLSGNYKGHRECYIEPDWLLIYMIQHDEVRFVRNGSHADLFG